MEEYKLIAKSRQITGKKAKKIRKQGRLPVVLYGHGVPPKILEVDKNEFVKEYNRAGASSLVRLYIDDSIEPVNVLFHQIDRHPVTEEIIHGDFLQVKLTEKIKTEIPIVVVGAKDAPVVKEKEGSIITNKDRIEVEAYPQDLVHEITVDVSNLTDFDQTIHVKDLAVPAKIEVQDDPEEVVVLIQEPRSEEELAKLEEEVKEDVEKVEVEKKGKEEEGEETEVKEGEKVPEGEQPSTEAPDEK